MCIRDRTKNGGTLQFAEKTLRADKDVVMTAVSQGGQVLQYADDTLQADNAVVMTAASRNLKHLCGLDDAC